jgi:hypothetical protein
MSSLYQMFLWAVVMLAFASCIEVRDTEKEQPKVELISPMPCDTLYFAEGFRFAVRVSDNTGLGNISMDIHNNFGQHNHGAHAACNYDAPKDAVSPFASSWIFALPSEKLEYVLDTVLVLPAIKNDTVFYDTGDYHFHIYVTDNDGYQVFTSLDVKVLHK